MLLWTHIPLDWTKKKKRLTFSILLAFSQKVQIVVWSISFGGNTSICSDSRTWFKNKTKKTTNPKLKLDYKESFLSELFLTQISSHVSMPVCTSICTGTVEGLCSRKERVWSKESSGLHHHEEEIFVKLWSPKILYLKEYGPLLYYCVQFQRI